MRAMSYYMNNRKRHQPLDRQVIVSGGVEYITIGKLSELLGRSVQTIHGYHRSGVLPSPVAFHVRGWRLYTKEQAETIAQTFRLFDLGQIKSLQELAGEVRLRLTEIGSEVASG